MINKYTIISWMPIYIFWLFYIIALIYYKEWKTIIYLIVILIGAFLSYKWFGYWNKKEELDENNRNTEY